MKIKAQKLLSKNILAIMAGFISTSSMALAQNNNFVENARLPNDVQATCVADISPWFTSRQVSENGWVNPANSLNPIFADSAHNTRCDFYKWGSQMFLWLTSGVGDQHVFTTTPGFYNISAHLEFFSSLSWGNEVFFGTKAFGVGSTNFWNSFRFRSRCKWFFMRAWKKA